MSGAHVRPARARVVAHPAARWVGWLAALAALTATLLAARDRLDGAHVALAYLLLVLGASARGGRALGFALAGAAFVAFNYGFLPPYHTLAVHDPLDWLVLLAFLVTSLVATQLLHRATATAVAATQRAAEVDRLAALGAEMLGAPGAAAALATVAAAIRVAAGAARCEVWRAAEGGAPTFVAGDAPEPVAPSPSAALPAVDAYAPAPARLVAWVAETGRSIAVLADGSARYAGDGDADPVLAATRHAVGESDARAVRALLLPLRVRAHTAGVLRLAAPDAIRLTPERVRLLAALLPYAALGVERLRLVETAERAEAERRVEALRSALLTAVSHDLRTPLTTIKGIAHEVAHGGPRARAAVIEAEADRLNDLVGDLLDLSRIQAGAVRPHLAVNTADELVGAALQRAAGALGDRPVVVDLPSDGMLAGRFDFVQALRVLVNLLENAAKYAPPATPVTLRARRDGARLVLTVLDHGPGIPDAERTRIFEPFHRPAGTPPDVRGTGLGLSIARGLAEAQDGTVHHEPRPGGGSAFVFTLPAADAALPDESAVPTAG